MSHIRRLALLPTLFCLCTAPAAAQSTAAGPAWPQPLDAYAGDAEACIAIHHPATEQYFIHNRAQCEERLAPCSTFKVPNALVGLESGVLAGPTDVKRWDGQEHSRVVQNRDHDLASAMRHSVVWYFQDVVRLLIRQTDNVPDGFAGELYGKTGSCMGPEGDYGWFTGFLRRDGEDYVFAVNVKGPGQWGADARRIAIEALGDMQ